jgi:hypothetical protein
MTDDTTRLASLETENARLRAEIERLKPAPGLHQVGSLQSTASASDIYSEGGWLASAARYSFLRRQGGAEGNRHGAGGGV